MKKTVKVLLTLVVFALVASVAGSVFAVDPNQFSGTDSDISGTMSNLSNIILRVVQVIGTAVAVIMLIVLAIKYISAAPGDKADIKKHAVVYVVGAVVLFAASGILQIVKNFAGNVKA